jgi:hypothetical protein
MRGSGISFFEVTGDCRLSLLRAAIVAVVNDGAAIPLKTDSITLRNCAPAGSESITISGQPSATAEPLRKATLSFSSFEERTVIFLRASSPRTARIRRLRKTLRPLEDMKGQGVMPSSLFR